MYFAEGLEPGTCNGLLSACLIDSNSNLQFVQIQLTDWGKESVRVQISLHTGTPNGVDASLYLLVLGSVLAY